MKRWCAVVAVAVAVVGRHGRCRRRCHFFAPHQPDDGSRGVCVCVRYVYTFQCMRIEYEFNAAHNAISNPTEERKPNDRERVKMK